MDDATNNWMTIPRAFKVHQNSCFQHKVVGSCFIEPRESEESQMFLNCGKHTPECI